MYCHRTLSFENISLLFSNIQCLVGINVLVPSRAQFFYNFLCKIPKILIYTVGQFLAFFSAKVVVELAKLSEIQAAVLCHPSLVTVNDIKGKHNYSSPSLCRIWWFEIYTYIKIYQFTTILILWILFCVFPVVKSPISILAAEIDQISPPELVKQFEEVLSGKPEVRSFQISLE